MKPKLIDSKTWWRIYYEREAKLDMMPGGAQGARPLMDDYINKEEDDEEEFTMDTEISDINDKPLYFVTEVWSGRMHVNTMRNFDNISDARNYAATLTPGSSVIYEIFSNKEPRKLK